MIYRVSTERRTWLLLHQELESQRRLREKRKKKARRRGGKKKPVVWSTVKFSLSITPQTLDFDTNYETTIGFLERIRRIASVGDRPLFITTRRCSVMAPEVALVLGAEIERCLYHRPNTINGNFPKAADVRAMLRDIGFFSMLNFNNPPEDRSAQGPTTYVRMKAGVQGGGQHADDLQRLVLGNIVATRPIVTDKLIAGLNEAMLNIHQHAYPESDDLKLPYAPMPNSRWWIAGYRNEAKKEIGFMAFDQGVGIPATLPKKRADIAKEVLAMAGNILAGGTQTIDHLLIQRAVEIGQSRTGEVQRGHGLNDFKKLITAAEGNGSLRILSGRGSYIYNELGQETAMPLPMPFHGTLVIWRLAASPAVVWES